MNRTRLRRTALLGLVTAAGVVAAGAWSEFLHGSGGALLLAVVIVVSTAAGVWKGVPVTGAVAGLTLAVRGSDRER